MVLVQQIMEDSPNLPNSPLSNFLAIWYHREKFEMQAIVVDKLIDDHYNDEIQSVTIMSTTAKSVQLEHMEHSGTTEESERTK